MDEFERHRPLLFSIAYRMLGSVADAEDAVQDAFIRWQRASENDIRSPKAFLVTVVSRVCINHLKSARVRRETYVGEWLPEPVVTDPGSDVSRIAQVDESVSMAMLLLMERLTPAERAVFLLSDTFEYSHAEIAAILDTTEANSRQLLSRARQRVQTNRPRFTASGPEHMELLEQFNRAAGSGDIEGLLTLLADDVVMHADGGGKASSLPLPVAGADQVARVAIAGLARLNTYHPVQRFVQVNGEPGIVSYVDGRPQSVFAIELRDGRITAIYIVTNPEKLSRLPALSS